MINANRSLQIEGRTGRVDAEPPGDSRGTEIVRDRTCVQDALPKVKVADLGSTSTHSATTTDLCFEQLSIMPGLWRLGNFIVNCRNSLWPHRWTATPHVSPSVTSRVKLKQASSRFVSAKSRLHSLIYLRLFGRLKIQMA
jgi:hypothetical protein